MRQRGKKKRDERADRQQPVESGADGRGGRRSCLLDDCIRTLRIVLAEHVPAKSNHVCQGGPIPAHAGRCSASVALANLQWLDGTGRMESERQHAVDRRLVTGCGG